MKHTCSVSVVVITGEYTSWAVVSETFTFFLSSKMKNITRKHRLFVVLTMHIFQGLWFPVAPHPQCTLL